MSFLSKRVLDLLHVFQKHQFSSSKSPEVGGVAKKILRDLIRLVVVSLITVMSLVQYYSAWYNHTETIKYLARVPKYRIQVRSLLAD